MHIHILPTQKATRAPPKNNSQIPASSPNSFFASVKLSYFSFSSHAKRWPSSSAWPLSMYWDSTNSRNAGCAGAYSTS